jgi:hypothetical protein
MASQGHPPINTFHMIKHDLTCLKVASMLHPPHQIKSTNIYVHGHFENEHFFSKLFIRKIVVLNVVITNFIFEGHNVGEVVLTHWTILQG